ncbi:hypothetical protein [Halonatronum saccharophilum]|uniref:hypothetical protein n=1 Tax=Halonatronum saccharophilum TaxID=150060 RepID=UPI00048081EC|nr:hypothetical protein [Halonatronum saccharophilum]
MSFKLAIIGLGDVRKKDKGITIYLLDKLKKVFSNERDMIFLNGGFDGEDLYNTLMKVKAEKVIVLDTIREVILPGEMNYLKVSTKSTNNLQELLMVTIGISNDEWGKKLSDLISEKFYYLLDKLIKIIKKFVS